MLAETHHQPNLRSGALLLSSAGVGMGGDDRSIDRFALWQRCNEFAHLYRSSSQLQARISICSTQGMPNQHIMTKESVAEIVGANFNHFTRLILADWRRVQNAGSCQPQRAKELREAKTKPPTPNPANTRADPRLDLYNRSRLRLRRILGTILATDWLA